MPEQEAADGDIDESGTAATENKDGEGTAAEGAEGTKPPVQDGEGTEVAAGDGTDKVDEDEAPPVRKAPKSPKDFIIARKQRQLEKAKQGKEGEKGEGDDDEEEEEGAKPPAESKDIEAVVERKFKEKEAAQKEQEAFRADMDAFIQTNPQFAPFRGKAEKWAADPNSPYSRLPVQELLFAAAGKALLKIGATIARKADIEAEKSKAGGSGGGSRVEEGKVNPWDLSKTDFEKFQLDVKSGKVK